MSIIENRLKWIEALLEHEYNVKRWHNALGVTPTAYGIAVLMYCDCNSVNLTKLKDNGCLNEIDESARNWLNYNSSPYNNAHIVNIGTNESNPDYEKVAQYVFDNCLNEESIMLNWVYRA